MKINHDQKTSSLKVINVMPNKADQLKGEMALHCVIPGERL